MSYTVRIKNNATGEVRSRSYGLEWSEFWWTEGNMGCDCNLELEFRRAAGEDPDLDETSCSDDRFTVLDATMEDGQVVVIYKEQ